MFLNVIAEHIAGDPMNPNIRWVKLSRGEISEQMKQLGVSVSRNIVRKLLKKHNFVKRKMQRKRSTGKSIDREQQFQNIIAEKEKFMNSDNPIISIDTKKKEQVGGNLHRDGSVYCTQAIEVSDHDYVHLADLKIAPHGIYDLKQNKAHINIGISAETAEFICDSLKNWWLNIGKNDYPKAQEILMFCDSGGANSYRTDQWNEARPGFLEADTVAHCGTSLIGNFVWSLTMTDIYSGWTENRAVWNKGAIGVVEQIEDVEKNLPFEILGFDCDNGSEFLNWHLMRYFSNQQGEYRVQFTRSRPYHSDDNAHVEQKNWTNVRQLFGYERFENQTVVELMNDVYKHEISWMNNYFLPNTKLKEKRRIEAKIIKAHDKSATPYQRLMQSEHLTQEKKEALTAIYQRINPFELKKEIQKKVDNIFRLNAKINEQNVL